MNLIMRSQSPYGAPGATRRSGRGGERRSSVVSELLPWAKARDTKLVTTRRMPSDAHAALWQAEAEALE